METSTDGGRGWLVTSGRFLKISFVIFRAHSLLFKPGNIIHKSSYF